MQNLALTAMLVFTFACSSKSKEGPTTEPPPTGSGSAMEGSAMEGSAMEGSGMEGSAMEGSAAAGSAMEGSDMAAGSGEGSGEAAGSAAFDFDKLTTDEKKEFMKKQVVPTMKPLFQDFDKKKFANFGCKTCHGKNPAKSKYKMPNPALPKLDFAKLKAGKQAPKMAEFMGKTVKPEMAKLLQQPEMTESHPDGFGCLECHVQKK